MSDLVTGLIQQWRRSYFRAVGAYIELVHPGPVLIVLLATAALSQAIDSEMSSGVRLGLLVSMLGAQIVIGVVNELVDRDIDRLTKPGKPLSCGRSTERGAQKLLISGLFLLISGSVFLDWTPLSLAILGCGVGVSYSLWFKRTMFAWVPYVIALPLLPIWIATAVHEFRIEFLTAYPIGLCAVGGVQIAQSVTDVDADRRTGIRSLTTVLGEKRAMLLCWTAIATSALVLAIVMTDEPIAIGAAVVVLLAVLSNVMLYRSRPTVGLRTAFPTAAIGLVLLGIAWVYAIST